MYGFYQAVDVDDMGQRGLIHGMATGELATFRKLGIVPKDVVGSQRKRQYNDIEVGIGVPIKVGILQIQLIRTSVETDYGRVAATVYAGFCQFRAVGCLPGGFQPHTGVGQSGRRSGIAQYGVGGCYPFAWCFVIKADLGQARMVKEVEHHGRVRSSPLPSGCALGRVGMSPAIVLLKYSFRLVTREKV